MIEDLQTAWEAKYNKPAFSRYHDALKDGLDKIKKYYSRFDKKPAFILALGEFLRFSDNDYLLLVVLHPYYKLAYIELAWGGAKEQEYERSNGNPHVVNWQDEVRKVLEKTARD